MSFSLGSGGGVNDPHILKCLRGLAFIVQTKGYQSQAAEEFMEKHKNDVFVDTISGHMHTFKELAEAIGPFIQGFRVEAY